MNTPRGSEMRALKWVMSRPGLFVFLAALLVRALYLWDISDSPTFLAPIVDANTHKKIAMGLLEGEVGKDFFWRSIFYPLYLSAVFLASGSSILAAKTFQALLGAVTCWLTYRLGKAHFGARVGVVAALMTIFCGPLLFWESELVAAGWASFWSILLIGLFVRAENRATLPGCLALGLCSALAVLTRPSFVPFVILSVAWLCFRFWKNSADTRSLAARLGSILIGFCLIAAPVAMQTQRVAGRVSILPGSGSMNLYIGNNPRSCETLLLRPGREWNELFQLPFAAGQVRQNDRARFFRDEVIRYGLDQPLQFSVGIGHKLLQLVNGREVPRNVDIYDYREWSILQRALSWKIAGFGFPWGLLLPLGLIGIFLGRRPIPPPILLFVATFPLVIAVTFVAGRYRAPLLPSLSLLAALGVVGIASRIRRGEWRSAGIALCAGLAIAVLAALPEASCEEEFNHGSEMYIFLGLQAREHAEAQAFYEKAVRRNPQSTRAREHLANLLVKDKKYDRAIAHYDAAIELESSYWILHKRGIAHLLNDEPRRAIRDFSSAIALMPDLSASYLLRGEAFHQLGEYEKARRNWELALKTAKNSEETDSARSALQRMDRDPRQSDP